MPSSWGRSDLVSTTRPLYRHRLQPRQSLIGVFKPHDHLSWPSLRVAQAGGWGYSSRWVPFVCIGGDWELNLAIQFVISEGMTRPTPTGDLSEENGEKLQDCMFHNQTYVLNDGMDWNKVYGIFIGRLRNDGNCVSALQDVCKLFVQP